MALLDDAPEASQLKHLGDKLEDANGGAGVLDARDGAPPRRSCASEPPASRCHSLGTMWSAHRAARSAYGPWHSVPGAAEIGDRVANARALALDQGIEVVLTQPELVAVREIAGLIEGEFGDAPEGDQALFPWCRQLET